jgi:hypothetical protein
MNASEPQRPPFDGALALDPHGRAARVMFPARPALGKLLAGRPAEAAATLLPALFALCGQAHGLAARVVIEAARGHTAEATAAMRDALADEMLREHVRSVFLDWPQQLAVLDQAGLVARQAALIACPVFRTQAARSDLVAWAATHVFGRSPDSWHALFASDGALDEWCRGGTTVPARWLAAAIDDARTCGQAPFPALPLETMPDWRAEVCDWLLAADRPPRHGSASETGCWLRTGRARHAADRLMARLQEIAGLVLGTTPPPRVLAWPQGRGRALTLVEIARGVLLHAAQVDSSGTTLVAYGVQAPTDWNFAPAGPVAKALESVAQVAQPARREHLARLVATAYAPCLPFEVAHAGV